MIINFIKMHGLGNDFVIIDNTTDKLRLDLSNIRFICNRRFGIGCDQLILTENITPRKVIKITIYNSDGTKAPACGNATRCVAYYAIKKYQISNIKIQTDSRIISAHLKYSNTIVLNMGVASFSSKDILLLDETLNPMNLSFPELNLKEKGIVVNVGNPHIVFITNNLSSIDLSKIGSQIENHKYFPEKINVEFINIVDRSTIIMKVWERGTGVTTACGTGATAVFAVAQKLNLVNKDNVKVILDGGELLLRLNKENCIILEGKATLVFEGKLYLN